MWMDSLGTVECICIIAMERDEIHVSSVTSRRLPSNEVGPLAFEVVNKANNVLECNLMHVG